MVKGGIKQDPRLRGDECFLGRARSPRKHSHLKLVAKVNAADVGMRHDLLRQALHQDHAVMDDVGAIDDFQRGADVMIGDQHADAAVAQMHHQIADIAERDRVDAGERLVEQDEMRLRGEGASDFDAPPLAARQC